MCYVIRIGDRKELPRYLAFALDGECVGVRITMTETSATRFPTYHYARVVLDFVERTRGEKFQFRYSPLRLTEEARQEIEEFDSLKAPPFEGSFKGFWL